MPASKKVTREDIIEGALDTLRESGFASVNARSVAKKLGHSTQPIYLSFKNMDELKMELTKRAILEHTNRVMEAMTRQDIPCTRYSSYGIGFVRFAKEEKQFFRFLYLEEEQTGKWQDDIDLPQIIQVIWEEYGYLRVLYLLFLLSAAKLDGSYMKAEGACPSTAFGLGQLGPAGFFAEGYAGDDGAPVLQVLHCDYQAASL